MNISVNLSPKFPLEKALKEAGIEDPTTVTQMTISGTITDNDLRYIREGTSDALQELDLSGASFEKNEIPDRAFGGYLISVTIPDSVTEIHRYAFGCQNLTTITANSANPVFASIDGVLFSKDKTELIKYPEGRRGDYVIPDSVTKIGRAAFFGCRGLTSITIPASVVEIGVRAFMRCSGLISIVIPDSATKIEDCAFNSCNGLTSIVIPDSVTEIGGGAFLHCANLTSVIIPDSVTKINRSTFAYCGSLMSVVIPDSVTEIGTWAFRCCSALTSIVIPKSVTKIEQEFWGVFFRCTAAITVHPDNPAYSSENGVLFNKDKTKLLEFPQEWQGDYVIPSSVVEIGGGAFSRCTGLTSVFIPATVSEIRCHAFRDCPASVVVHPDNLFFISDKGKLANKKLKAVYGQAGKLKWKLFDDVLTISANFGIADYDDLLHGWREDSDSDESVPPWYPYRKRIKKIVFKANGYNC